MIVCSCNIISDRDIEQVLVDIFRKPDAPIPIDFLETQLHLLDSIGLQNYGHLQAAPANKADGKQSD